MKQKPFKCGHCGRRFATREGTSMHGRDVHATEVEVIKASTQSRSREREPSMAQLFIDAQIDRSMGVPIEGWIEDMIP